MSVIAGSTAPGITLNVRTGALVTFSINDARGRVRVTHPGSAKAHQTNVRIGVVSGMGHYFADLVEHTGAHWTYAVAVPVGTSAWLWLDTELDIADQDGSPVPKLAGKLPIKAIDKAGVTMNLTVK